MRAKGDWGCRPFPLMQSPLPGPADRHQATAVDLNTGYNSLHRSYPRLSPSGSSFDWKRGVLRRLSQTSGKYDSTERKPIISHQIRPAMMDFQVSLLMDDGLPFEAAAVAITMFTWQTQMEQKCAT